MVFASQVCNTLHWDLDGVSAGLQLTAVTFSQQNPINSAPRYHVGSNLHSSSRSDSIEIITETDCWSCNRAQWERQRLSVTALRSPHHRTPTSQHCQHCLSVCLSVWQCMYMSNYRCICLSVYLKIYVCLSIYVIKYLSVSTILNGTYSNEIFQVSVVSSHTFQ